VVVAHVVEAAAGTEAVVMMMVVQAMAAAQAERGYGHEEAHFKEFSVHDSESGLLVHVMNQARRATGRFSLALFSAIAFLLLFEGLFCTTGFLLFTGLCCATGFCLFTGLCCATGLGCGAGL
jgi:hypothetical protein